MVAAVPRPRVHDPDRVLDAVESLAARSGATAVTIRAVESATGVSNGALYHAFGSRAGLLAEAWLRAAHRFLVVQRELVDAASGPGAGLGAGAADGTAAGAAAVVAAADAPVVFAEREPAASKLLHAIGRDDLLAEDLPADLSDRLRRVEAELVGLLIRLSVTLWDRRDAAAVDTVTICVVDLPTAIVLARDRPAGPTTRAQLHAAVRAVLAVGPPRKGPTR